MTIARDVSADGESGSPVAGAIAAELRAAVSEALAWMVAVPDRETRQRPHAAGWSPGEQDWTSLLERWVAFNEQVAIAITRIPGPTLKREHAEHNLDQVAWKTVAAGEPATLEYFIRDYIGHLRHHIAQLAALVGPRAR